MRNVFARLCANAVKFTRTREQAVIELGMVPGSAPPAVFVRDNGVGFDPQNADRLFGVFHGVLPLSRRRFVGTLLIP